MLALHELVKDSPDRRDESSLLLFTNMWTEFSPVCGLEDYVPLSGQQGVQILHRWMFFCGDVSKVRFIFRNQTTLMS